MVKRLNNTAKFLKVEAFSDERKLFWRIEKSRLKKISCYINL